MTLWMGGPFWQVSVSWQRATEGEGQEIEKPGALLVCRYVVAHLEFAVDKIT
jgi:hypothetical protein